MFSIRQGVSVAAAAAMGAGLFVAVPAQAAQYPPTKPVRCGAAVDGNTLNVRIRPRRDTGYKFIVQRRKGPGNWVDYKKGRTDPQTTEASVKIKFKKKGRYRLICIGAPNRLDGSTSFKRVR